MNKINDLFTDLDSEIDLSNQGEKKIRLSKIGKFFLNDIFSFGKKDINLKNKNIIKISKNKTSKFDSLFVAKKEKGVDIITPEKNINFYLNLIFKFFKKRLLIYKLSGNKKHTKFNKVLLFVVFLTFFFYGNKIIIENLVTNGYESILGLKSDFGNIEKSKNDIKSARISFIVSNILFKPFTFIPNDNIKNVDYIISGGKDLSKLLSISLNIYSETLRLIDEKGGINNIYFSNLLTNIRGNYEEIYSLLYSSLNYYSKVGDLGNTYLNDKLNFTKEKLRLGLVLTEIINKNYDVLLDMLGSNGEKKYLVIFQNNDEIRATGGFMGSTAMITILNGKITNVENSDIYALEWLVNKVYTDKEVAPEGLNKITGTFGLRDANYYPMFSDSSTKIKFFLDKIGYKVDGLVYINQNVILDLLDNIDGVDSKILNEKITSDNFSLVLSTLVEAKVFKLGTLGSPKQILFDFALEFKDKLLLEKDYYAYFKTLINHIKNRDIVFYSFSSENNSFLWKLGVNGEINLNSTLDYNYPVYISIGGNKTDRYIDYRYDKTVKNIEGSCNFETKLDIYKSHHFSKFEDEKVNSLLDKYEIVNKTDILNIQGRGDNKSYVRVIIPKNTSVNLAKGQKVIDYDNYKIVELYINTEKLETSLNTISYIIDNPSCEKYTYKFFKQAGIQKYNINFDIFSEKDKYSAIKSDFIYKKDIISK
ncbi:MAG: DUF4012 domain-containing protein [Candidatus Gracilibacteria bacterium]|nr:DUF4012 domain-containing protein [Candidatus Gracilibacteria bacterium]